MGEKWELETLRELQTTLNNLPSQCQDFKVEVHVGNKVKGNRREISKTLDCDYSRKIVTLYI